MPNRLREVRLEAGCKMLELAARVRCSPAMLSAIERYDHQPREDTKERIANALEVPTTRIWPNE